MCFAIDSPDSLKNIEQKWAPEIKQHCPGVPFILIGNKKDLRNDSEKTGMKIKQEHVRTEQGQNVAANIGAQIYLECSAKTKEGVNYVFEKATRFTRLPKKKNTGCYLQ